MPTYEGDYYTELNKEKLRWELYYWEGNDARFVTSVSYAKNINFKNAKRIILRLKKSIEAEDYRKEWEHDNEISS